ncbi:MAG: hypothetical protein MHM6MM_001426 [Cercozoa sp. M6MM]
MTGISDFVKQHRECLESEREAQLEQAIEELSGRKLCDLEASGRIHKSLKLTEIRAVLFSQKLLTFVLSDEKERPRFKAGDNVVLLRGSASFLAAHLKHYADDLSVRDAETKGVVTKVKTGVLAVAVDVDDSAEIQVDSAPNWCLVKVANDVSFVRTHRAMRIVGENDTPMRQIAFDGVPNRYDNTVETQSVLKEAAHLNESQQQALRSCLTLASGMHVIHGPPGTGKTTTLISIVRALVQRTPRKRCLVCAPSNVAVDHLAKLLLAHDVNCVRLGQSARFDDAVQTVSLQVLAQQHYRMQVVAAAREELEKLRRSRIFSEDARKEMRLLRKDIKENEQLATSAILEEAQVVLSTLNSADTLRRYDMTFDYVFVDECAQATEAECWIALQFAKERAVLAGDHCQLPPTIVSRDKEVLSVLSKSLMERVIRDSNSTLLNTQYRMHENILHFSNAVFYRGELLSHESNRLHLLGETRNLAAAFVAIDTAETSPEDEKDLSKFNEHEAALCMRHVTHLLRAGVSQDSIAIITPYRAQLQLLRERLEGESFEIETGTVDAFQGREKDAIILSLVRSNDQNEIGFLRETRRTNVALTRAKKHLCVIGDFSGTLLRSGDQFALDFIKFINTDRVSLRSVYDYANDGDLNGADDYEDDPLLIKVDQSNTIDLGALAADKDSAEHTAKLSAKKKKSRRKKKKKKKKSTDAENSDSQNRQETSVSTSTFGNSFSSSSVQTVSPATSSVPVATSSSSFGFDFEALGKPKTKAPREQAQQRRKKKPKQKKRRKKTQQSVEAQIDALAVPERKEDHLTESLQLMREAREAHKQLVIERERSKLRDKLRSKRDKVAGANDARHKRQQEQKNKPGSVLDKKVYKRLGLERI